MFVADLKEMAVMAKGAGIPTPAHAAPMKIMLQVCAVSCEM